MTPIKLPKADTLLRLKNCPSQEFFWCGKEWHSVRYVSSSGLRVTIGISQTLANEASEYWFSGRLEEVEG